jgi:hypothetical protein
MARINSSEALVGKTVTRVDGSRVKIAGTLVGGYKMAEGRKLLARNLTKANGKFIEIEKTDIRMLEEQDGYVRVKKDADKPVKPTVKPDVKPVGGALDAVVATIDKPLIDVIKSNRAALNKALGFALSSNVSVTHSLNKSGDELTVTLVLSARSSKGSKEADDKPAAKAAPEYNTDALTHPTEAASMIKSWDLRRELAKACGLALAAVRPGLVFVTADGVNYVLDYSTRSDSFVLRQVGASKIVRLTTLKRVLSGEFRPAGVDDSELDAAAR